MLYCFDNTLLYSNLCRHITRGIDLERKSQGDYKKGISQTYQVLPYTFLKINLKYHL